MPDELWKSSLSSPLQAKILNLSFFFLRVSGFTVHCLWSSPCNLLRPVLDLHPLPKWHEHVLHEIEWKLHFVLNCREVCHGIVTISQRTLCAVGALTLVEGRNMLWGQLKARFTTFSSGRRWRASSCGVLLGAAARLSLPSPQLQILCRK